MISSQDFRNSYEKFYRDLREYLWPYTVLEELAEVEQGIFTSFIDIEKLRTDFRRLYKSIKEEVDEDELLNQSYTELSELIEGEYEDPYLILPKVEEVHPDVDKKITNESEDESESEEEPNGSEELNEDNQEEEIYPGFGSTD